MATKVKPLSQTQRALLIAAEARDDHPVPPPNLPVAAARQVIRSMLNAALVEEVPAPVEDATYAWRSGDGGEMLMLRMTSFGLTCVRETSGNIPAASPMMPAQETTGEVDVSNSSHPCWTTMAVASGPKARPASMGATDDGRLGERSGVSGTTTALAASGPAEAARGFPARVARAGRHDSLHRAAQALLEAWTVWSTPTRQSVR